MEKKETENVSYKSHVLVLPFPLQGHINPMLQFSKRLASKGVRATLATTVHVARSSSISIDNSNLVQIETISDGYDLGGYASAESDEAYVASLKRVGSVTLARLLEKLAGLGRPVNGLVYDSVMIWALDVGKEFGVFKVPFFTQSCSVNSVYYHVNKGLIKVHVDSVVSLPGLPPLGRFDVPSFLNDVGSYPAVFDSVVGQFDNVDEADWVLFNTFYELEPEVVDWMRKLYRISTIGPMVPTTYLNNKRTETTDTPYTINLFKPNTTTCSTWLNTKPPNSVIYVSFGSLAALTTEQTTQLFNALTQADYNFLWVVRESEQPKLPQDFTNNAMSEKKGLVVSWCDQVEVLSHEAVGCFVTHCGFNSVLEALAIGVPVLGVPQWTDQCTNGFFVEEVWGNGVRARAGRDGVVGREEFEERLREVMEGERGKMVKKNVRKWRDLAREAVGEGGSSDKSIDEFVANLVRSSRNLPETNS